MELSGFDDHRLLLHALQEAAERISLGVVVAQLNDPERLLYVNEAAAGIFGRSRAELEGSSPFSMIVPELVAKERERVQARGTGAAPPVVFETIAHRPDGRRVPIEIGVSRIVTGHNIIAVAFVRDNSARLEALATLRRSEERFRKVAEGGPDGVAIVQRGEIVFLNQLAAELFGHPEPRVAVGTQVLEHLVPEDAEVAAERISRIIRTGEALEPHVYRPRLRPERYLEIKSITIDWEGEPAMLSFVRDISARKRIEQELVRADRLASIGMMSAAVAHEINNPLAYVQLCLQYLERELPGTAPDRILEQVRNARQGVERVATIVRDLRTFARSDDDELGSVDVLASLEQAIKLVDNDVRHRARIVRELDPVPRVKANASRLEQVFVNLLINAAQAIPSDGARDHEIHISTSTDGDEVTITIRDTGPGIAPELRERVFEPFFTTKAVGVGTGLGLAVCRGIIEQLGGKIEIVDAPRGAIVCVKLPADRGTRAQTPEEIALEAPDTKRLRVLVVDDEPLVRRALATVLGGHHDITLAENGRHALDHIGSASFDVILCDMMMPVMNGKDLYEHLVVSDPALARRFVFITGGSIGPIAKFLEQVEALVLPKPFELSKVLELVAAAAAR